MWDLPGPGLKPVSPALAGGFLTTAPPGKPLDSVLRLVPPSAKESRVLVSGLPHEAEILEETKQVLLVLIPKEYNRICEKYSGSRGHLARWQV